MPQRLAAVLLVSLFAAGGALASEEAIYLAFETRLHTLGGPHEGRQAEVTFHVVEERGAQAAVLWTQGPQTVPLRDGYLRVVLGDQESPLTREILRDGRWLLIDCDGCVGRTRFRILRRGEIVSILGAERPNSPGPAAPKALLRNKRLHDQRAYPTGIVPGGVLADAYTAVADDQLAITPDVGIEASPSSLTQGAWTAIGPSKVTGGQTTGTRGDVTGRINAIEVHPTDPNIAYACGAQGGVWKTVNAGTTWTPLTDNLPSLASGALAISPSNPSLLYLGTGEANFSLDSYWGAGVFKSTDAGTSWSALGPIDPNRAPLNRAAIAALRVHPSDPNTLHAAVGTFMEGNTLFSGGVYRSSDGGSTWTRALGPGLPSGTIAASDIVLDAADPNVLYAALGYVNGSANNGVYKSTDGGASYTKLGGGLPTSSNVGRINLAQSRSNTQVLYAAVHDISTDGLMGIWRTGNAGAAWTQQAATGASCNNQCWYDQELAVAPTDPNTVFFGGVNLYRSTNGGGSFSLAMDSTAATGGLHADQHALTYTTGASSTALWVANDGGVWRTTNASGSLPLNWINLNTNLALLQFQSVAVPPNDPNVVYGGTQDNGTNKYTGNVVWSHVDDGDGGQTAVDFIDPSTVYHTFQHITMRRSDNAGASWVPKQVGLNTGDRAEFYPAVEMDPTDPAVLYYGTFRLYRTLNQGDLWASISGDLTNNGGNVTAIGPAKSDGNVIYVGTSNGLINATSNLGGNWTNVTAAPLPNRFVTSIAVHPADANTAYVSYSGFGDPNTGFGHVFRTTNRGASWSDLSANLPDFPVNQIAIDPASPQMIYLATDLGPYVSTNAGQSWRRYAAGFPNVATFEMAVQQPNLLFAATHGRGMFQAFGCTASGTTDLDGDGVADFCDNCTGLLNASQVDADADGFGASCECADTNATIFPGAPPPDEVQQLTVTEAGQVSWPAAARAQKYDVYRGSVDLESRIAYNHTCFAANVTGTSVPETQTPPTNVMFYYLIASQNCMASTNLGDATPGPGTRPIPSPCP